MTLRAQGFLGATGGAAGCPDAAPARRGPAGHDQRAGPLARAGRLRPARCDRPGPRRARLLDPARRRRSSTGRTRPACCPIEEWPLYAFRRRALPRPRAALAPESTSGPAPRCWPGCAAEGPLTATQLGGAKNGGRVVGLVRDQDRRRSGCSTSARSSASRRDGWRRVYDLPERVAARRAARPASRSDAECLAHLVGVAGPGARAWPPAPT